MTFKPKPKYQIIYADPPPDVIKAYITQQQCWICSKGGWKALSQHLVKKHGLPAAEVREMAYMFKHERLISEELSEAISKDALRRFGNRRHIPIRGESISLKHLSSKAKDILKNRIKEIRPIGPLSQETKLKISQKHTEAFRNGKIPWNKLARLKRVHDTRSAQAKEYWRRFKELPPEEQRRINLERAASRRVRVYKNCIICGTTFDVIPSHEVEQVTCGKPECKRQNQSNKAKGHKHTSESIAKMSVYAKERHQREGGLFGRIVGVMK